MLILAIIGISETREKLVRIISYVAVAFIQATNRSISVPVLILIEIKWAQEGKIY